MRNVFLNTLSAVVLALGMASVGHAGDEGSSLVDTIKADSREAGHAIADASRSVGHEIADTSRKVGHAIADDSRKAGHAIAATSRKVGGDIRDGAHKANAGDKPQPKE